MLFHKLLKEVLLTYVVYQVLFFIFHDFISLSSDFHAKECFLFISHPDDDVMFFSPFLHNYRSFCSSLRVLSVSNGGNPLRSIEFKASMLHFGVISGSQNVSVISDDFVDMREDERSFILDFSNFADGLIWDESKLASVFVGLFCIS